ncbi:MAG: biopolymer transporter ExbD [Niastella sp.]|nr:biopolymer transporter ExbD [Niastella sp.]
MKCITGILLCVYLVTSGCKDEPRPVETKRLFLPKDSEASAYDSIAYTKNVVTLILAAENNIFYYTGELTDQSSVGKVDYKGVRNVLLDFKRKAGDSLVVIIKPHSSATYKNTVDILDEMTINEIKKYALIDLTAKEQIEILHETNVTVGKEDYELTVTAPKSISTTSGIRRKSLIITIHANNALSWQTYDLIAETKPKEIVPATKENLKKVISEYRKSIGADSLKTGLIIRGSKDGQYPVFKTVIDAMKELEIFKFSFEEEPTSNK